MKCPSCGADVPEGAKFCRSCGGPLGDDRDATTVRRPVAETVPAPAPSPRPEGPDDGDGPKGRRRGGKSRAAKVIGACLAGALLVGAGAGAVWFLMDEQARKTGEQVEELQGQLDEMSERLEEEAERADAAEADAAAAAGQDTPDQPSAPAAGTGDSGEDDDESDNGVQSFVGTWTGELSSIKSSYANCYGASEHPLKITIKSIDENTGQLKADVEVLYHGHESVRTDTDSSEGDRVMEFEDLTGTFSRDDGFELFANVDGDSSYVKIEADIEQYSYGTRLEVSVDSTGPIGYGLRSTTQVDNYELAKS